MDSASPQPTAPMVLNDLEEVSLFSELQANHAHPRVSRYHSEKRPLRQRCPMVRSELLDHRPLGLAVVLYERHVIHRMPLVMSPLR